MIDLYLISDQNDVPNLISDHYDVPNLISDHYDVPNHARPLGR